jgi:hypothetical protein
MHHPVYFPVWLLGRGYLQYAQVTKEDNWKVLVRHGLLTISRGVYFLVIIFKLTPLRVKATLKNDSILLEIDEST